MAVWSSINMSYGLANKRLDAERYKPQYLENEKFLSSIKFEYLKKYISDISGGATPKGAKYPNNGIRFVRVQNIRDNFFDLSDVVYIDETVHNGQLFRSQIQESDVLLTITGVSYGNSSTAYKEMLPANINQHSVRIALKSGLLPEVLSTFFCCKYGRLQSDSKVTGDTRPALTYPEIGNYIIPIFDMDNQMEIQKLVKESLQQRLLSHSLYHQAEELLAKELQLDQLQLPNKKWYTADYYEAVKSKRLDSTHFRDAYSDLFGFLENRFSCKRIGQIVTVNRRGLQPVYSENGTIMVVNSKHLSTTHILYDQTERTTEEEFSKQSVAQIKNGDVLIYTTGAYIGLTNAFNSKEKALASNHVNILRLSDTYSSIDPNYLALVLNSKIGKLQTEKHSRGSAQLELYPADIAKFVIPIINNNRMREIGELVRNSLSALNQSKQLLAQAKRRVEELIEQEANKYK